MGIAWGPKIKVPKHQTEITPLVDPTFETTFFDLSSPQWFLYQVQNYVWFNIDQCWVWSLIKITTTYDMVVVFLEDQAQETTLLVDLTFEARLFSPQWIYQVD